MHGLVVLDEKDEVIRPAILWNDGRTGRRDGLSESGDWKGQIVRIYGKYRFCRIYSAEDSLAEGRMSRRILRRISKIMLPKDYLAYKLTRRVLHGCIRCIRYAADGCEE